MINKFAIFCLVLFISACKNNSEENFEEAINISESPEMLAIQKKVEQINANDDDHTVANSLSYQHNDGSAEEVFAYLDKKQKIVKLEEKFKIKKDGNSGVRFFYFENGKRIMSTERFIDKTNGGGKFRERKSYYDKTGNAFATQERLTQFEEDLEKLSFEKAKPYNCSIETAENVLNQKGLFATTFQGFASDGPIDYLIVGGPGETGYASALAIQYADQTTNYLKANQVRMIDTPLLVDFEKMMDERKLEFQVLTNVKIDK